MYIFHPPPPYPEIKYRARKYILTQWNPRPDSYYQILLLQQDKGARSTCSPQVPFPYIHTRIPALTLQALYGHIAPPTGSTSTHTTLALPFPPSSAVPTEQRREQAPALPSVPPAPHAPPRRRTAVMRSLHRAQSLRSVTRSLTYIGEGRPRRALRQRRADGGPPPSAATPGRGAGSRESDENLPRRRLRPRARGYGGEGKGKRRGNGSAGGGEARTLPSAAAASAALGGSQSPQECSAVTWPPADVRLPSLSRETLRHLGLTQLQKQAQTAPLSLALSLPPLLSSRPR